MKLYTVEAGCVDIRYLVLGMLENNVYLVGNDEATAVVDPTGQPEVIMEALKEWGGRSLDMIFLTHHHYDHTGAACDLREATGAAVVASAIDTPQIEKANNVVGDIWKARPCPVDRQVADGDTVELKGMAWKVMGTPGHTPGSVCFYFDPATAPHPDRSPVLLAGDTLFFGSTGRTDFEDGSMPDMRRSLKKLAALPDDTIVLPGHDRLTTIAAERDRVFRRYA
ncbi:MAG: MBL fold metallo-hydrolase [Eggerthellaceae bacterium]|jgi:glyoxylase-like metal-dependent hydrolase (beta-lactamase superfamily II)|nr:MBL fold metallo-hydrolase [Eggerthellaceae bacterium]MDR2715137.1 MBL fold metallo-hydrolase [Coriobacteriaceae bacterium]